MKPSILSRDANVLRLIPCGRRAGVFVGALVLIYSVFSPVRAQSLADAAARAQAQRQAPPDTQALTDHDLASSSSNGNREAISLELTMPILQRYCSVRTALLRAMVESPDLAKQVLGATGRAGRDGVVGLEREYGGIPAAVDAIGMGHMTVHEYVITEVAFMAAVGVLAGKLSVSGPQAGTIGANIEFLNRHEQEIAALWQEASALEARLGRQVAASPSR